MSRCVCFPRIEGLKGCPVQGGQSTSVGVRGKILCSILGKQSDTQASSG